MRKITSLLMLFCAFVGTAFAQTLPAADKAFTITTTERGGLAANNAKTACVGFNNVTVENEEQKYFAFIQYDGKVYLYNVWAEKFVNKTGDLTATLPVDDITIEKLNFGFYFFKFDDSHNVNLGGSSQLAIDTWNTKDAGNQFTLTEVADFDPAGALAILDNSYTITYKFVYNEKEVASQTTKVTAGANYPSIDSGLMPWGAVATVPAGAPTGNETVTIDCTIDTSVLPFVPSATYDDANMKWYYLQFHATDKNHLHFNAADEVLLTDKTTYDDNDKDAYSWAFVGNPFDGYTIYNRKAYAQNANLKLNAAEAGATLGTADHKFMPTSSTNATNGFYLQSPNGANTQRFNRQGGNVVYWSGADGGSTFMVVERPMGPVAELEALVKDAQALLASVNANVGTTIGEYTQETANALAAAITTAEGKGDAATAEDVATLKAAMKAVKVILPTVNQYYQIHSSLAAFADTKAVFSNGTRAEWTTLNGDDKSFYWKAVAAENGNVVFQNAADGKYMVGNAAQSGAWTMAETPSAESNVDIKIFSKAENANGYEYGIVLNGWQLHCANHGEGANNSGNIVSWNTNSANSASSWFLVPVDLKVFHDVTYNFVYNGDVKFSQKTSVAEGAAYPEVVPALPYGVTATNATKPEGTVTAPAVVNYTLNVEHELPFKAATSVENIKTWYYAQMHANANVTAYVEDNKNDANNVEWADNTVDAEEIESHLWGFVGDIWTGIKMVNKGTGRAIVSTSGNAVMGDAANATAFVPVYSNAAYRDGWFCLKYPNNADHLNANGGIISSWWDDDNGSSFFLTEYNETEIVVTDADYATLYLGQATYIPEGVEVYAVTGVEGGWATMTAVEGVLPANTGVILKNDGTYTFKTAGATGSVEGNLLRGSVEDTCVAGDAYVLSAQNDVVGLYKAKLNKNAEGGEGETHFLNNAFKAYLPATDANGARFLGFDFGTETGIGEVETETENAVIYDLAGRRVQKAQKGLYIVNGKKVIR